MVELVSIEPPENSDHNRGHKFPFYACEVLCSQNPNIIDKFFSDHIEPADKDEMNSTLKIEGNKEGIHEDFQENKDSNEAKSNEKDESNEFNYDDYCQTIEDKPCVENTELLEFLFDSFINQKELNYVLAGYFNKINHNLLYNKKEKVIFSVI
jgi:hypothetical protein